MTAAAGPAPDLADPRAPRKGRRGDFERYGWLFMRLSGIVLVILVLGHLFVTVIPDGGVQRVNWAFVAGRWASPWWRAWDVAMLWLAAIHGGIGLRTIINDYARRARWPLTVLLAASLVVMVGLGTFVIVTFDATMG